jgi:hypothetical protein
MLNLQLSRNAFDSVKLLIGDAQLCAGTDPLHLCCSLLDDRVLHDLLHSIAAQYTSADHKPQKAFINEQLCRAEEALERGWY